VYLGGGDLIRGVEESLKERIADMLCDALEAVKRYY